MSRLRRERFAVAMPRSRFRLMQGKRSHQFMTHPDGLRTVVPVHAGETIGPGLLGRILKDVDMEATDLAKLL